MINDVSGINEDGLDKLVMDIYNYAENLHKIFDNVSNIIDDTKDCYCEDTGINMRLKYNDFKKNLDIAYNKLIKYASELSSVKMYYQDLSIDIGNKLKINENNIIDQIGKE